jgi:hypothetical protein
MHDETHYAVGLAMIEQRTQLRYLQLTAAGG